MKTTLCVLVAVVLLSGCTTITRNPDGTLEYDGRTSIEQARFMRDSETCNQAVLKFLENRKPGETAECISTPEGYHIRFGSQAYDYYGRRLRRYDVESEELYRSEGDLVGAGTDHYRQQRRLNRW